MNIFKRVSKVSRLTALCDSQETLDRREVSSVMIASVGLIACSSFRAVHANDPQSPSISVAQFGAVGDGSHDDSGAFLEALAQSKSVSVAGGKRYRLTRPLSLQADQQLVGIGDAPTLLFFSPMSECITLGAAATLRNLVLDGDAASKSGPSVVVHMGEPKALLADCTVLNGRTLNVEIVSQGCRVVRGSQHSSSGTAIAITGVQATGNLIDSVAVGDNKGFGVWIAHGASANIVQHCSTQANGLELVGITYDAHDNRVVTNSAQGSGDNGISVTGYANTIQNNVCQGNAFNGIGVYGERNIVTGNHCHGNGLSADRRAAGVTFADIAVTPGFGGFGRRNLIKNNVLGEGAAKTSYGILVGRGNYHEWQPGMSLISHPAYVTYGDDLFIAPDARKGTVTGSVPPNQRPGGSSDGNVTWIWIGSTRQTALSTSAAFEGGCLPSAAQAFEAADNLISGNHIGTGVISPVLQRSNLHNCID